MTTLVNMFDAGPELGHMRVHQALVLAEWGWPADPAAVADCLLASAHQHAALVRFGGENADVGRLGLRMLPGLLSVLERLEVGDVRRARRRLRAVVWAYTGIRGWPSRDAWTLS